MNQEDPKPGVVIDVEPEPEAPQGPTGNENDTPDDQPPEPPRDTAKSSKSGLVALLLALLSLGAIGAGAYYGHQAWTKINAELAETRSQIADTRSRQLALGDSINEATSALQTQQGSLGEQREVLVQQQQALDEARSAFQRQEAQLAEENLRLQEREAELRAAVADVHRRVGRSGTQWIIAETEYLIRIANHRLTLARDTEAARVALELADQRLRDTKDPGWTGVREQIARDIAKLSTFDAPDLTGMSAQLSALIEQVPQLKIARATIGAERTLPEAVAQAPGERNWESLVDDVWSGFKDAVRIRERDEPIQAMLAPEHQFFLYENLKLRLEAARLALARGDQGMFRDSLKTATESLQQYFDQQAGGARAIAASLQQMQATAIRPAMPDISQSLRALRARVQLMGTLVPDEEAAQ